MMASAATKQEPTKAEPTTNNPFSGSTKAMFEDFEKVKTQQPDPKNMQDFEKNFMGMFP